MIKEIKQAEWLKMFDEYNADPTRFHHNELRHGDYFEKRGIPIPSVTEVA